MAASNNVIEEKINFLKGPIFIFGSSGFIGANLLDVILKYRKDCYAITHDVRHAWRLKLLNIPPENILYCDLLIKNSVIELLERNKPQTIFNLAAYGSYSKENEVGLIYETNLIGTLNILQHLGQIAAYVHAGSSSEYGLNSESPFENDEMIPNSHYAVSKVSTGYLLKHYGKIHQLPVVNLRLYSVYGPWEEPDRFIPQLIENAKQKKLPVLVSPYISRDFLFIDDCIVAFINAAYYMNSSLYGESINIGTGKKNTIKETVDYVIELFGLNIQANWGSMPDRKWDLKNWYGNYEKANRLLFWHPTVELKEGLLKTSQWQDSQNYSSTILPAFQEPKQVNKISCVIACYKDEPAITIMYERLKKVFSELKIRYEIIFVNDASPDNSQQVLSEICNNDSDVVAITHSRNFGSQSAFLSGMEISTGDAVVLMDGDLQDPPEIIPRMYEKWIAGNEVVYGRRVKREASAFMNASYKLFYKIFSRLSYVDIPSDAGDFSMIDRKVVNELLKLPEKDQFLRGLRAWVGFSQTGVDYVRPERMFGKSTNNWRKNIWWAKKAMFSFSFIPLEILSYMGFILTGISFLALIAQIIIRFLYPDIPHGVTTIIVLILFFGGVQLLAISILGEYLSKVFEETKGRPKFIRRSVIYKGKKLETPSEIQSLVNVVK
ncbi:MAG: NAD-dependent epimerase/dehydratase family protein [Bacteroidetes bacterium]|nr:NAD-dependent epimerase/dehydratase family protein [Bacteroidota bacterium]